MSYIIDQSFRVGWVLVGALHGVVDNFVQHGLIMCGLMSLIVEKKKKNYLIMRWSNV